MAVLTNPSFEDPGAAPGEANAWTSARDAASEDVAIFHGAGSEVRPYESFEAGWGDNQLAQDGFIPSDLTAALFESGTRAVEDFETSWVLPSSVGPPWNHQSVWVYDAANFTVAQFTGPDDFEDFEAGWSNNENFQTGFAPGDTTAASFDTALVAEDVEDFEEGWQNNQAAQTGFNPGDTTAAKFNAGADAFENFEGAWTLALP